MPTLVWKEDLYFACRDHVQDIGPKGITGYQGSDGSNLIDRLRRYGGAVYPWMELICLGQDTGREVVLNLLIDDGLKDRYRRKSIFNPAHKLMGCYSGAHIDHKTMTSISYTRGWSKKLKVTL